MKHMPPTDTPLDQAHAAMVQHGNTDSHARMAFYAQLATSELYLLLETQAAGETLIPRSFELPDGTIVLAFDTEERLADFTGGSAPYAVISGRALAEILAPARLGLGLNLDVAPSSILLPAQAMTWMLANTNIPHDTIDTRIKYLSAPQELPPAFFDALDRRLAGAAGLAKQAILAHAAYENSEQNHVLAFVGAAAGAQPALRQAGGEALRFSGLDAGRLDMIFLDNADKQLGSFLNVGLCFDIPAPPAPRAPAIPGSDPDAPPKLR